MLVKKFFTLHAYTCKAIIVSKTEMFEVHICYVNILLRERSYTPFL